VSEKTVKEKIIRVVEKPVEKAKVVYTRVNFDGYNKGSQEYFEVRDETSEKAYETLEKMKELMKK